MEVNTIQRASMKLKIPLASTTLALLLVACSGPDTDADQPAASAVEAEPQAGEYIEASYGGYSMRCMSGDDAAASIGTYVVTVLENGRVVAELTGARDGVIQDCWMTNIDADASAEVLVFTRSAGSGGYAHLYVYELAGNELSPANIPDPDASLMGGYQGRDTYEIMDGRLLRTFPVYLEGDANCCPGGGERRIEFNGATETWELPATP